MQEACRCFEQMLEDNPQNALITAYYADCLSMAGREANNTADMFGSAIKAMKMFDDVLNREPDILAVRLLRAMHSYRLPESFFRRTATAITDFEYLVRHYEQGNNDIPTELYHKLLYLLGKAHRRLGMAQECEQVWQKLLAACVDPQYRELITAASAGEDQTDGFDPTGEMDEKQIFSEGKRLHDLGTLGNKAAARASCELLQKVYDRHPNVPIVEAWYGSSAALAGKYSSNSQELFASAVKGIKILNHAVEEDPQNPRIRYLRAQLFFNLPEAFFHLTSKANEDFAFVISAYEKNKNAMSEDKYLQALYCAGECHKRLGNDTEAEILWKKLLKISSDPKYSLLLGRKLHEAHCIDGEVKMNELVF